MNVRHSPQIDWSLLISLAKVTKHWFQTNHGRRTIHIAVRLPASVAKRVYWVSRISSPIWRAYEQWKLNHRLPGGYGTLRSSDCLEDWIIRSKVRVRVTQINPLYRFGRSGTMGSRWTAHDDREIQSGRSSESWFTGVDEGMCGLPSIAVRLNTNCRFGWRIIAVLGFLFQNDEEEQKLTENTEELCFRQQWMLRHIC